MKTLGFVCRAVTFVALAAAVVNADYIITTDGSKIVGRIEKLVDGKLAICTDFAGKLEIEAARVKAIHTDEPINVQLKSGDHVIGTVEPSVDQSQSVVKSEVGLIPVTSETVTNVWRDEADSPEAIAAQAEVAKYKPNWLLKLEAGWTMTEGNTDTKTIRGRFDLDRKTQQDLLKFYASADYAEDQDVQTRGEYFGGVKYENMLTERWYWYARGELENDEFEDLDLRATVAGGLGYYWIKKPEHELKTRGGPGYRHESYENGSTRDDAILDLGLDYRLDVAPWMQFTHSTTYSPSLEEFDRYRLEFDTAMLFPLKVDQWKFKIGSRNTYNSDPVGDTERLDNLYYASIVLELKDW